MPRTAGAVLWAIVAIVAAMAGRRPTDMPCSPENEYRDTGWHNYPHWLGDSHDWALKGPALEFAPWPQALKFARRLQLRSGHEWVEFCRSGKRPVTIPADPSKR